MSCERHFCLNPLKIRCHKSVEFGACLGKDEWVSGIVKRKNETDEWLEVECCHYLESVYPSFVKQVYISSKWDHDVVIHDEKVVAIDYIKEIKKAANDDNQAIYIASIYRLKCPEDFDEQIFDINVIDDSDGTGKFTNVTDTCNESLDPLFMFLDIQNNPKRGCLPYKCLDETKIKCQKSSTKKCDGKNEWISNIILSSNGTHKFIEIECCHYSDNLNYIFFRNITFIVGEQKNSLQFDDTQLGGWESVERWGFFQNITVQKSLNKQTIYSASSYLAECSLKKENKKSLKKPTLSDLIIPEDSSSDLHEQLKLYINTLINLQKQSEESTKIKKT